MRWIVVIAAMAAKRQRTDAQQCDELPYDVATYAFTIRARDDEEAPPREAAAQLLAVSYTHLTLPTIYSV